MTEQRQSGRWYVRRDPKLVPDMAGYLRNLEANEHATKQIVNLYGISGIGKTYVLQQLFDIFKHDYDVIWLDFNLADDPGPGMAGGGNDDALDLARVSWQDAIKILETIPDLKGRIPQQITFDNQFSQPVDQMGNILCAAALDEQLKLPTLLLLDSLDHLPYWKWLQEQIIKPLLVARSTVILCVSRTPVFWSFWELRECCVNYELQVFQLEDTRQFLAQYGCELLADTVHHLIGGYPLALKKFVHLLDESAKSASPSVPLPTDIFGVLRPDTQTVLVQVGIMRRVHIQVMQNLLNRSSSPDRWETPAGHRRLVGALNEMQRHGYIKPHHDTSNRFVPEIRAALKAMLSSTEYFDRCRAVTASYYEIAYRQPKTEPTAFVEWLYFSTEQFAADPDSERAQWEHDLRVLCMRVVQVSRMVPTVGPELVGLVYTDSELIKHLFALNLLSVLREALRPLLMGEVPIQQEVRRACSETLDLLGRRVLAMAPNAMVALEPVLRSLALAGKPWQFDQVVLRDRLIELWPSLRHGPVRGVTELIVIMNSSGILLYDREARVYYLNPVIERLLWAEESRPFVTRSDG